MKKIYIIFCLFVSLSALSQAPRGFYLNAGLNQTNFDSEDLASTAGIGYKAGINFNMGYHETYNFQIEMGVSSKNVNLKTVNGDYTQITETKFNSQAFDAGFFFNYYILKPDEDKFFLGPQIGFNIAVKEDLKIASGDDINNNRYLPFLLREGSFNNMPPISLYANFGLTGGYNNFRFDLRYSYGTNNKLSTVQTDSFDSNNRYTGPTLIGNMNTLSFNLSYLIFSSVKRISK